MALFLSEAVEASLCYFFGNWLMKLKFPNLRNIHTFRQILTSIFLSVRAILKETVQCETPCISAEKHSNIKNVLKIRVLLISCFVSQSFKNKPSKQTSQHMILNFRKNGESFEQNKWHKLSRK